MEWLDELISKCSIVDTVSQYVQLTKKGSKHFGCCPFHNEKSASFCVNEDGQFYYCFGCHASGNAINFIMEIESLAFMDAAKLLAEKVNFTIPNFKRDANYQEKKDKKEILQNCMHDAFGYYYKNLRSEAGKDALAYLEKRGITLEVCNFYGIGLSVSYDGLTGFLRRKEYTLENLRECGLIEGERNNDAFSNRIIVPILDSMKKVIAFGGRIYQGEENRPKYKNSTNTFIFDKSKTLYGLNFVKEEKRNGMTEVILVEGYMDVIALGAKGIKNSVASMGTALTSGQAKELVRVCKNVFVCYDGDSAGEKAAIKNVETLSLEGAEVKIMRLPKGQDPDDYVRENGASGFLRLMEQALSLIEYKLKLCEENFDLSSANGRAKYASTAVRVLSSVKNETERAVYLAEVAKLCGVGVSILSSQVERDLVKAPAKQQREIPETNAGNIRAEQSVLHYLLFHRAFANIDDFQREWFTNAVHIEIFDIIKKKISNGEKINAGILYGLLAESDEMKAVINLELKLENEKQEERYFLDSALMIANLYLTKIINDASASYENESDLSAKRAHITTLSQAQQKLKLTTIAEKKLILSKEINNE